MHHDAETTYGTARARKSASIGEEIREAPRSIPTFAADRAWGGRDQRATSREDRLGDRPGRDLRPVEIAFTIAARTIGGADTPTGR